MCCNCNKPKRCCGNIPVRTCCPNPASVTRTEFYDYKNTIKTDMKDLDDRISDKELDLSEIELAVSKLELEKQNKLLAGDNIILTENADQTVTISATGVPTNVYTKTETDALLANKVDITALGGYYTKAEADTLLNAKQNTLTKQDLLTLLGLQEVQIQADDGQGTVRTLTVLGVWDTP